MLSLLSLLFLLDLAGSTFILSQAQALVLRCSFFRSAIGECDDVAAFNQEAIGGSDLDLWVLSLLRCCCFVTAVVVIRAAGGCHFTRSHRAAVQSVTTALVIELALLIYVATKCLDRLVDGPGTAAPSERWFWSQVAVTSVCSLLECRWVVERLLDHAAEAEEREEARRNKDDDFRGIAITTAVPSTIISSRDAINFSPRSQPGFRSSQVGSLNEPFLAAESSSHDEQKARATSGDGDQGRDDKDQGDDDLADDDADDTTSSGDDGSSEGEEEKQERIRIRRRRKWKRRRARRRRGEDGGKRGRPRKAANLRRLLQIASKDCGLLTAAFTALFVAAIGQAIIPMLTGQIINAVAVTNPDPVTLRDLTVQLTVVAGVTGLFTAIRGSIFTLAMARFNIRVRKSLLDSLLSQVRWHGD